MITLLATLLLSTPTAALGNEAVVTVALPIEASVDGSEMTLGDIAKISAEVESQAEAVRGFSLGYAPAPGYSRVIQRWRLQQQLAKEFPRIEVEFEGKAACRVWPRTAEVTPTELEVAARKALAEQFSDSDAEVALHGELGAEIVPAGRSSRRLEADLASGSVSSGTLNVPVAIFVDDVKYRTVWVPFDVTLYRELPVLRRTIPLGGKIEAGDLELRRVAVEASFERELLQPSMLIGASARRALPSGKPVSVRDVVRALAIKAGETITLEVRNGRVVVRTKAIAMTDGFVGDVVALRTLQSGKELTARVTSPGNVKLQLGDGSSN
jgi:flagella basal body P-ring formation protein FlgA